MGFPVRALSGKRRQFGHGNRSVGRRVTFAGGAFPFLGVELLLKPHGKFLDRLKALGHAGELFVVLLLVALLVERIGLKSKVALINAHGLVPCPTIVAGDDHGARHKHEHHG